MKRLLLIAIAACHSTPRSTMTTPVASVAELAAHRAQMVQWLHEYREAGAYPMAPDGMPMSVFKDSRGVRCPMAELIYRSGHADLVDAVAREHNDVRLADVHEGPLHDWMLASGLTMKEIAMVQGAADIDRRWMFGREMTILAQGELRGRLYTAERALIDGTDNALLVAAKQLPNKTVPVVAAVTGKVVPEAAMHSTSQQALAIGTQIRLPGSLGGAVAVQPY